MALWKQLALSIVVLAIAATVWARYFPGADAVLAEMGLEWLPVARTDAAPAERAGGPGGPAARGPGGLGGAPMGGVVTAPVVSATINDRLSAIGTGQALRSVAVMPFASGRITEILVSSGATLSSGDVIARLDSEAEEIALDRAGIALEDARGRLQRIESLRASNTATQVQVSEAQVAVRNAELALRDAELALQRRSIVSPISGVVGIISVTDGTHVTAQTEIVTVDDRSRILIDFWVPERYASVLAVGAPLSATSVARPNEAFHGEIVAIDNRVDAQSRTLRVQAGLDNPGDRLRAGMSFQVRMQFPGDTYPAVDPLAVQWGTDGAFVWVVTEGVAARVPVRIVQRNTDSVLVAADLAEGAWVVVEGVHNVREGREVRIARRTSDAPGGATSSPSASIATSGS